MPEGPPKFVHAPNFPNKYNIPPGDVPDYVYIRTVVISATTILLVFSTLTTIARFAVRKWTKQSMKMDDWFMLLALLSSYIAEVGQFMGTLFIPSFSVETRLKYGLGKHQKWVDTPTRVNFQKVFFAVKEAYEPAETFLKISIVLFYMRLFPTRGFKRAGWIVIGVVTAWGIATFLDNVFQCIPANFFWDKTIKGGKCKEIPPVAIANGATSTACDIAVLTMPMPMIWKLQVDLRKRVALMGIFALGIFIVRFVSLSHLDRTDLTYTQVFPGLWTSIEVAVGIVCGNLPLLKPLFRGFFSRVAATNLSGNKKSQYSFRTANISGSGKAYGHNGFSKMSDGKSDDASQFDNVSEVELKGLTEGRMQQHLDPEIGRIRVQTDVAIRSEENKQPLPHAW
ncbi:MAG: hypothetical protein Q9160_000372 [Pyrenula sp. 1 TL-2023]